MANEKEFADKIIQTCLRVQPGEEVQINTFHHTIPLAEALFTRCYQAGAVPYLLLNTDRLFVATHGVVPIEHLRQTPQWHLCATEHTDAIIYLAGPEDAAIFGQANPEAHLALIEAYRPIYDMAFACKVRQISLTGSMCTPARARQYGVDFEAWQASVNAAMEADYDEIGATGRALAEIIHGSGTLRLTAPNGTHLTVEYAGTPIRIDDGILDEHDLENALYVTEFPTGKVQFALDPTSAKGVVVTPRVHLWGKVIENMRWQFEGGRLVDWEAERNGEIFAEFFKQPSAYQDVCSQLIIGINPGARLVKFSLNDWLISGMVTIGIGDNLEVGGTIQSNTYFDASVPEATLNVDGQILIENGQLLIPAPA